MRSKLVEVRKNNNMTQEDVSKAIGVTRSCYSNYENGIRNISLKVLIKLKSLFCIQDDEIFLDDSDTKGIV